MNREGGISIRHGGRKEGTRGQGRLTYESAADGEEDVALGEHGYCQSLGERRGGKGGRGKLCRTGRRPSFPSSSPPLPSPASQFSQDAVCSYRPQDRPARPRFLGPSLPPFVPPPPSLATLYTSIYTTIALLTLGNRQTSPLSAYAAAANPGTGVYTPRKNADGQSTFVLLNTAPTLADIGIARASLSLPFSRLQGPSTSPSSPVMCVFRLDLVSPVRNSAGCEVGEPGNSARLRTMSMRWC